MTRQQAERHEAIEQLRNWIKPGDTVYTILDNVSRSGMSRAIRVVLPYTREDGTIDHVHPNWAVGKALGLRHWKRNGREQDALVVGGCGMDMGFHLVYELSHALYDKGYACLGKGKCPSNYHVNYRASERCMCQEYDRETSEWRADPRCGRCIGTGTVVHQPQRYDLVHTDGYALRHRWM